MDKIEFYPVGTKVTFDDNLQGQVINVSISENRAIYEIAYLGPCSTWREEKELQIVSDKDDNPATKLETVEVKKV